MHRRIAFVIPVLAAFAAGCDAQPIQGRCENNVDCDRNATNPAARCVSFANPGTMCSGGDCICCPIGSFDTMQYPSCVARGSDAGTTDTGVVDTGVVDTGVVDVVADNPVTDAPAADALADVVGTDTSPLQIGQSCTLATQCGTGFCAHGVCCNSACTCAGCSCNSEPDFRGVCTRVMSSGDAGAPDAATGDAGADAPPG